MCCLYSADLFGEQECKIWNIWVSSLFTEIPELAALNHSFLAFIKIGLWQELCSCWIKATQLLLLKASEFNPSLEKQVKTVSHSLFVCLKKVTQIILEYSHHPSLPITTSAFNTFVVVCLFL